MPFKGNSNTVGERYSSGTTTAEYPETTLAAGASVTFESTTGLRTFALPRISALVNLTSGPTNQLDVLLEFRQANKGTWRRLLVATYTNPFNEPQLFERVFSCYSVRLTVTAPALAGNYVFVPNLSAAAS